jgi:hypothetical protein
MNRLMRATLLAFVVTLAVWGLIAVWTQLRLYELLRTWQTIAVDVTICLGTGDARVARVCGLAAAETLGQAHAVPVGSYEGNWRRTPSPSF